MDIKVGEFYRIKDEAATRLAQMVSEFKVGEKVKVLSKAGKINGYTWYDIECSNKAKETIPCDWLEKIEVKKEDKPKGNINEIEKMLQEVFGSSIITTTKEPKKKVKKEQHNQEKTSKPNNLNMLTLRYDGKKVTMVKNDKIVVVDGENIKDKVFINLVDSIFKMCGE